MDTHHMSKRRKVRKGTFSCWECKRRKMKCVFETHASADDDRPIHQRPKCVSCQRRGLLCISQDQPEEMCLHFNTSAEKLKNSSNNSKSTSTGQEICQETSAAPRSTPAYSGIPTPESLQAPTDPRLAFFQAQATYSNSIQSRPTLFPSTNKHAQLSWFLYEALPSRETIQRVIATVREPWAVVADDLLTVPYSALRQTGMKRPSSLADERPGPDAHPAVLARHMLQLAVFLLVRGAAKKAQDIQEALGEPVRAVLDRLVGRATGLVTTNDALLGSIEGLEAIMIEGVYQSNVGNLRRSWVAVRRAVSIAQLMGLGESGGGHYTVLSPRTQPPDTDTIWLRVVTLDRHLCLMLGLPQCTTDESMSSPERLAGDTPMGRLERLDCVLGSRILERNERWRRGVKRTDEKEDYALTRAIDRDLQKAARLLPGKWWLTPTLMDAGITDVSESEGEELFWDTRRLFAQVMHYNLVVQLHLPYMLGDRTTAYSRITCVNAARELLTRFVRLRSFIRVAYSCRTIDFTATMAALTLMLAHLHKPRPRDGESASGSGSGSGSGYESDDILAHQYLSDRAMIELVQENMERVNDHNSDALSKESSELLQKLLAISDDDDSGDDELRNVTEETSRANSISVQTVGAEQPQETTTKPHVSVHIPYFGTIRIAREGMSKTKEMTRPTRRATTATVTATAPLATSTPSVTAAQESTNPAALLSEAPAPFPSDLQGPTASELISTPADELCPYAGGEYPGLAAVSEDWAFQGVDMAFFDSLMRASGSDAL